MFDRKLRVSGLALVALALAWVPAEAATLKETFLKTYPLQSGGRVEVHNTNGGISVEAWDRNEVRVEAIKEVKADSEAKAREVMQKIRIDAQAGSGAVRIETRLPRNEGGLLSWMTGDNVSMNVNYKIRAPREMVASLHSTNGGLRLVGTQGRAVLETTNGGVTVERVEGDIRLRSTNGGLTVIEAAGTVDGETTNGGINAHFTEVDGDISLSTTNGGVTLKVPRDIRASIDLATSNGGIHSDLEVEGGQKGRRSLTGDINGGGGSLKIRSTNGGVRLVAE